MKRQIILVALAGILLGGVLGFWGAGFLAKKRIKKFKTRSGEQFLGKRIFWKISPKPEQARIFNEIKVAQGARIDSLNNKHRKDIKQVLKETYSELVPLLDKDQKRALEKRRLKEKHARQRKKRKNRNRE